MRVLYICQTYYHVLVSLLKASKTKDKCDIMLTYTWKNNQLLDDDRLKKRLSDSKIFYNVIVGDFMNDNLEKIKKDNKYVIFKKYLFSKKYRKNNPYKISEYDEINIFNDNSPIGLFINQSHIFYNLLEDGTDCYINNKNVINHKLSLKKILKRMIGSYELGQSKFIKIIEVNNKEGVFLKNKNIVEVPKKSLINSLNEKERKKVLEVFIDNSKIEVLNDSILIITQPLSEDKIVKDEINKINLYRKIIGDYITEGKIVIKTHPREITDYFKYFDNVTIVNENFPLELLNYFDNIKIRKAITISSTSINIIENVDKRIILGWNYINH